MPLTVNHKTLQTLGNGLRISLNFLADAIWPRQCHVCDGAGAMGLDLCPGCAASLPWMPPACLRCALPSDPAQPVCLCELLPSHLDRVHAAFLYKAPVDRWVPRLKFHGDLGLGRLLGELMVEGLADARLPDVVVPVPLHRPRLRERGYNQAMELAAPVARRMGLPLETRLLLREKRTAAQSRLGLDARTSNLAGAFTVNPKRCLPRHVALVDDVMTTGATLQEAAWALKDAGVERVDAWVCARVP